MDAADIARARAAAMATVSAVGLPADDAIVVHDSNKLALRVQPCDVFARVAHVGQEVAAFEVELAQRLADVGSPVARLDPRVPPAVHQRDGFAITLWTSYDAVGPSALRPAEYASALARLHADLRALDVRAPRFTDRVDEAQQLVADREETPTLADDDRTLLADALRRLRGAIVDRGADEQLLHGEPHPGNVLRTTDGWRFIDLETCCRGPVEFDLAHVPEAVSARYPDVDEELLGDCRALVLAMVAAWRWDRHDQFPGGRQAGRDLLEAIRRGAPWPTLDTLTPSPDGA